jgi:hypothetical protein
MSTAARGSDERKCNEQVDRIIKERKAFGQWWREWAQPRHCDNAWMREIAFEAFKAGANQANGEQ